MFWYLCSLRFIFNRPILRPRETIPSTITIQQAREDEDVGTHQRAWLALQQVHLHPDYSTSILDDTVNRPNESMQRLMNRTIAGTGNFNLG